MDCPECNKLLNNGYYVCATNNYVINDRDNNFIFNVISHDLSLDDEEINDSINAKYCSCGYWIPIN